MNLVGRRSSGVGGPEFSSDFGCWREVNIRRTITRSRPGAVAVEISRQGSGVELRERIVGREPAPVEVDILAPVLTSHTHYGVSDIDRELEQARARLEISLRGDRRYGPERAGYLAGARGV